MSGVGYYYTEAKGIELIVTKGQAHCYPWHMHTRHWTMGVIRAGTVCLTTEACSQRLYPGQQFCLRPYEPHSLSVEPESSLVVICFDEQGIFVLDKYSEAFWSHISGLQTEEQHRLAGVMVSAKDMVFSGNRRTGPPSFAENSIREIMRLMLATPDQPLGVDQMAAQAGYSQWHFLRVFQKMTGMTPHAFQLLCRLRLSRSLLRADTAPSTAAVSAGFADQSHMHKVFRHHHGMTPGEFKKASVRLEP